MDLRDWGPGNRWRSVDYGCFGVIYSRGIKGSRQIGEGDQSNLGKVLVRTIQRIGLRGIRFRGSQFKESDDGVAWILIWIFFIMRSHESSGITLDRLTKRILFFYARIETNTYGFDLIRVKCCLKILRIIWIHGDNHAFTVEIFGTNEGIGLVGEIGLWRQYKKRCGGGV